jgi:hypothetical protein
MNHEAHGHQAMTDDGVRDHGHEDDDEVRSYPRVSSVTGDKRQNQVACDCTTTADRETEKKVLELRACQASGASPL